MTTEGLTSRLFNRRTTWLYEPVRQWFEDREGTHESLREDLNAARMGVTVDEYLARSAVLAVIVGVLGSGAGVALTVWLASTGTLAGVSGIGGLGGVGSFVGNNRTVFVAITLAVVVGAGSGIGTWYYRYTLPGRRARRRARELSLMLPHAVTYMYALTRGGLDVAEVMRRLAGSEETYGEVAREMGMVVNQMDYLGQDLMQAVRTTSEVTPCRYTSEFLGDLHGVIESGGDVESFLSDQREEATQDARAVQRAYIENISLFAEVYVTVLIAGPLFLLILLMVLGITGADTLTQVNVLVYAGIPGASMIALLLLDQLGSPFQQTSTPSAPERTTGPDVLDHPEIQAYAQRKRRVQLRETLRDPVTPVLQRPAKVLWASVPAALLTVGLFVLTGMVEPSVSAIYESAFIATTLLFVIPFVVATTPLVVAMELRRRRASAITDRFPDVLSSIASANRMGIRTADAIEAAAEDASHALSDELTQIHNEIEWFNDMQGALVRLSRRARLQITSRVLGLVVEADRASGNLAETLSVAADDARRQREFARDRSQALSTYVAAGVISFLVYLGILLLIDQYYFQEALVASQQTGPANPELPVSLQSLEATGFKVAFFHSSLVQALFIGLVSGKMVNGSALSGLKYSLLLIVLTVVAFGVF